MTVIIHISKRFFVLCLGMPVGILAGMIGVSKGLEIRLHLRLGDDDLRHFLFFRIGINKFMDVKRVVKRVVKIFLENL